MESGVLTVMKFTKPLGIFRFPRMFDGLLALAPISKGYLTCKEVFCYRIGYRYRDVK